MNDREALEAVRRASVGFSRTEQAIPPLTDLVGDAKLVLIGEATHGTDEFYRFRAALTAALIRDKHFNVIAVEADWPDAYRVNRWVRDAADERDGAAGALDDFVRFPRWMWRNTAVVEFIDWLHRHNSHRLPVDRVGFYGLDLYSLHASMDAVLVYLAKVDPPAAARARRQIGRASCRERV